MYDVSPAANAIAKISYTHDKVIDIIVANPRVTLDDISGVFGYTPGWLSRMMNSDAFKLRMAVRRNELVDPLITAALKERFEAIAMRGLEVIQQKIDQPAEVVKFSDAAKAVELGAKGIGIGGFGVRPTVEVNNFDLRGALAEAQERRRQMVEPIPGTSVVVDVQVEDAA